MTAPEVEPWLGHCHFVRDPSGDVDTEDGFGNDTATVTETLTGVAAVWADGRDAYETVLRAHLAEKGGDLAHLRLLWAENVMPATEWMVRHAREKKALDLARHVYAQHPVELGLLASDTTATTEPVAWLDIKEIPGIEPLDDQFGVHPRKTVPDGLLEPLFGEVEPTAAEIAFYDGLENVPPLKTYAVIDAAKLTSGASAIETCGMPWRCMFKGKAAIELGDVAPYLIELDQKTDFTRILFTHDPNANAQATTRHLWHREPAIYIRSRADIDEIQSHFRKFTRVRDEQEQWYYLRFWEPRETVNLFSLVKHEREDVAGLLHPREQPPIQAIYAPVGESLFKISSRIDREVEKTSFILTAEKRAGLGRRRQDRFATEFGQKLFNVAPRHFERLEVKIVDPVITMIETVTKELRDKGFLRRNEIAKLATMAGFHGTYFLQDARVRPIVRSYLDDILKSPMVRLQQFEEAFQNHNFPNILMANAALKQLLPLLDQGIAGDLSGPDEVIKKSTPLLPEEHIGEFVIQCREAREKRGLISEDQQVAHLICALAFTPFFLDDPLHTRLAGLFAEQPPDRLFEPLKIEFLRRLDIA
ncbi:DUF4123 domain-containing protein [Thalassospira sp. NFXS8]|uniref:DUF4123 domain-containing protein n=1 Tax=Thalassospira sp. NFXS8 TaxID=2819093 RepID=UPI0032E044A8